MAYDTDYTYCDGKGCVLRDRCHRYTEGQRIKSSRTEGQYYWMDHCDVETRDGYKELNLKRQ